MNVKYVVIGVVALLLAVSEMAQQGGAIDTFSQRESSAPDKPQLTSATVEQANDEPEDYDDVSASESDPDDTDSWFASADTPSDQADEQPTLDSERGAVPIEKQGLELPSPDGVMPSRFGF